jgi:hypothetical protein
LLFPAFKKYFCFGSRGLFRFPEQSPLLHLFTSMKVIAHGESFSSRPAGADRCIVNVSRLDDFESIVVLDISMIKKQKSQGNLHNH